MRSHILLSFFLSFAVVNCFNFPFESTQLQDKDIGDFTSISFGNLASPSLTTTANSTCRAYPDTPSWPSDSDWTLLNASLSGALLKPTPPGSVCYQCSSYDKAKCDSLLNDARQSRFYINDPLTVLTAWTQGNTCEPTASAGNASCGQGGFAVYVVNATTVKQIQVAVNFARNKNLRLVIKNSGHDFYGRSTGAGSLSIWTHYLKDFEFLPSYNVLGSSVMAARVGSGIESWEAYQYMDHYNMTLAVPGGSTLAPYGGWMQGGGHSVLASTYGLGADQPLELQVVTADGRFVTASPEQNSDLFYAMLGGGPGTFGVVTSAIVKAYPPIEVSESAIAFNGGSATTPPAQVTAQNLTAFWAGVNLFFRFGAEVVDNGGATYNYVSQLSNTSYNFRTTIDLPGMTIAQNLAFVQPLITALINLGIPVNATQNTVSASWGPGRLGVGDAPGNSRFASRFFPRANWGDDDLFEQTMGAIRESVEAGYSFHGIHMAPTLSAAGYPGCRNHVPRHFRNTIMHSDSFDSGPIRGGSAAAVQGVKDAWTRHNFYMDKIRNVTVGGGAYINEGDVKEPNWQESFFGERYGELVGVKRKWDPWGLFWGPALVGSEAWSVRTEDGLPTQVGMLCKTGVEMGGLVVGQKVKSSI